MSTLKCSAAPVECIVSGELHVLFASVHMYTPVSSHSSLLSLAYFGLFSHQFFVPCRDGPLFCFSRLIWRLIMYFPDLAKLWLMGLESRHMIKWSFLFRLPRIVR